MTKRPSVIGNLSLAPSTPEATAAAPANVVEITATAEPKRQPKPGVKHTSLYLPAAVDRKLKEIALTHDSNRHDIIMQGIDLILARYGTSIAKLTKPNA